MKRTLSALAALSLLVASCSTPSDTPAESVAPAPATAPAAALSAQNTVTGRVPTGGIGQSSIVVLQPTAR